MGIAIAVRSGALVVLLSLFITCASAARGSSAGVGVIALYKDANCESNASFVSFAMGVCYKHAFGDFLFQQTPSSALEDKNAVWMAVQTYKDATCSTLQSTSAEFANMCSYDNPRREASVMRMNAKSWTLFYHRCSAECLTCEKNATAAPPGECVFVNGAYKKAVLLGYGSGAFYVHFFDTTDGTCGGADSKEVVPDSTCYGSRGVMMSSI